MSINFFALNYILQKMLKGQIKQPLSNFSFESAITRATNMSLHTKQVPSQMPK